VTMVQGTRYVVLLHSGADAPRRPCSPAAISERDGTAVCHLAHFDWMFEVNESLLTWATEAVLPADRFSEVTAIGLPLHRMAYLDYEGPVSANRGSVRRIETGLFQLIAAAANHYEFELMGDRCGRLVIQRTDGGEADSFWRMIFWPKTDEEPTRVDAS